MLNWHRLEYEFLAGQLWQLSYLILCDYKLQQCKQSILIEIGAMDSNSEISLYNCLSSFGSFVLALVK